MKELDTYTIDELKEILKQLDEMKKLNDSILELNKFKGNSWDEILECSDIDILGIIVSRKEKIVKELFFNRGVEFK